MLIMMIAAVVVLHEIRGDGAAAGAIRVVALRFAHHRRAAIERRLVQHATPATSSDGGERPATCAAAGRPPAPHSAHAANTSGTL